MSHEPMLALAGRMNTVREIARSVVGPDADTNDPMMKSGAAMQIVARYLAEDRN
jgi:hypothetical protein